MNQPEGRIRPILQVPDERLQVVCDRVEDPTSPEIQQLAVDLLATLASTEFGGGLAAPQIGSPLRVVVGEKKFFGVEVLINPEIIKGKDRGPSSESCYSLDEAGTCVTVQRFEQVRFRATTIDGRRIKKHLRGLAARMLQHEIDHLDGKTIDTL